MSKGNDISYTPEMKDYLARKRSLPPISISGQFNKTIDLGYIEN